MEQISFHTMTFDHSLQHNEIMNIVTDVGGLAKKAGSTLL
jgi:hypothetical protein